MAEKKSGKNTAKTVAPPTTAEEKEKALATAMAQIEKQYGKGAIMRLGENASMSVDHIRTGSLALDLALGIGGIPRGRIVEIFGPESSGKTTVALHCVAEAQKAGGTAAFIDVEHALDPVYASNLGVDIDNLLVSQPDSGEQALEIAEALVRSGAIDIIVVDSVAALTTKAEIEGEMGDSHVGQLARLMSQAMRKLTAALSKANCAAIFINQLRDKIGVLYGSSETTTGGRALKFYSSVRIDVRRLETIKDDGEMVGSHTRARVVKNKVAPPFKEAEFDIMYGKGISHESEIVDMALKFEILRRSGAWIYYGETRLGQGRDNVRQMIAENKELAAELEEKIMAKYAEATAPGAKSEDAEPPAGDDEPVIMPVEAEAPARPHKKIDIDIAVDD